MHRRAQGHTLRFHWWKHVTSHSDQTCLPAHLLPWFFWLFLSSLFQFVIRPPENIHITFWEVKKRTWTILTVNFHWSYEPVLPTLCSLPMRNMCSVRHSSNSSFRHVDDPVLPLPQKILLSPQYDWTHTNTKKGIFLLFGYKTYTEWFMW